MSGIYKNSSAYLKLLSFLLILLICLPALPANSQQIITDGYTNTQLNTTGTVTDVTTTTIKGANAFNSFARFNVDQGNTVNLVVPNDSVRLINIIKNETSNINGTLNSLKNGVAGGNIYLVNPHGLIVGAQGSINAEALTIVTPTQQFVDNFFNSSGNPDDASVTALINDTMPINPDAKVNNAGRITGQTLVNINAGSVENTGTIELGDVVNVDKIENGQVIGQYNGDVVIKAEETIVFHDKLYFKDNKPAFINWKINIAGKDNVDPGNLSLSSKGNISLDRTYEPVNTVIAQNLIINAGKRLDIKGENYVSDKLTLNSANLKDYGITLSPESITTKSLSSNFLHPNGDLIILLNTSDVISLGNLDHITIDGQPLNLHNIYLSNKHPTWLGGIGLNGDISVSGDINCVAANVVNNANISANNITFNARNWLEITGNLNTPGKLTMFASDIYNQGLIFTPESINAGSIESNFLVNNAPISFDTKSNVKLGNLDNIFINNSKANITGIHINNPEIDLTEYVQLNSVILNGNINIPGEINIHAATVAFDTGLYVNQLQNTTINAQNVNLNGWDVTLNGNINIHNDTNTGNINCYAENIGIPDNFANIKADNISLNASSTLFIRGGNITTPGKLYLNASDILNKGIFFTPEKIHAGSLDSNFLVNNAPISFHTQSEVALSGLDNIFINNSKINITAINIDNPEGYTHPDMNNPDFDNPSQFFNYFEDRNRVKLGTDISIKGDINIVADRIYIGPLYNYPNSSNQDIETGLIKAANFNLNAATNLKIYNTDLIAGFDNQSLIVTNNGDFVGPIHATLNNGNIYVQDLNSVTNTVNITTPSCLGNNSSITAMEGSYNVNITNNSSANMHLAEIGLESNDNIVFNGNKINTNLITPDGEIIVNIKNTDIYDPSVNITSSQSGNLYFTGLIDNQFPGSHTNIHLVGGNIIDANPNGTTIHSQIIDIRSDSGHIGTVDNPLKLFVRSMLTAMAPGGINIDAVQGSLPIDVISTAGYGDVNLSAEAGIMDFSFDNENPNIYGRNITLTSRNANIGLAGSSDINIALDYNHTGGVLTASADGNISISHDLLYPNMVINKITSRKSDVILTSKSGIVDANNKESVNIEADNITLMAINDSSIGTFDNAIGVKLHENGTLSAQGYGFINIIAPDGDLKLDLVSNAGRADVKLTSAGNISGDNNPDADIYCNSLLLNATQAGNIGSKLNPLVVDTNFKNNNGTLTALAYGYINIKEVSGDLFINAVSNSGRNNIELSSPINILDSSPLDQANIFGNSITLSAITGNIGTNQDALDIYSNYKSYWGKLYAYAPLGSVYIDQFNGDLYLGEVNVQKLASLKASSGGINRYPNNTSINITAHNLELQALTTIGTRSLPVYINVDGNITNSSPQVFIKNIHN